MPLELQLSLPLILILILSIKIVMVDAKFGNNKTLGFVTALAGFIVVFISAAFTLTISPEAIASLNAEELYSKGTITYGGFAAYFDMLFCVAAILTILAALPYFQKENSEHNAFYSMMVFAVAGMMLIAHSANLLSLFIGIEIMSISFYVLAGYFRTKEKSIEAALKYFLLGAFATGFLLYGIALIYGATGSLSLPEILTKIAADDFSNTYLTLGIALMLIGLCFKVAAFPFHQWAPDVYTGAPTVVTAFMSTAGKAAALIAFIIVARALFVIDIGQAAEIPDFQTNAIMIIAIISAATMLIGNITALVQKNIKRMLAYSSVAHAGYLLMGIVANSPQGWEGIIFYATAYLFMQIGAFIVLSVLERKTDKNLDLDDYSGISKSHPFLAAIMAIFMFSLAGIPPFAGFFGKFLLFTAAIDAGFTWLTIIAVISSMISVYFYIGLIVYMYFRKSNTYPLEADMGSAKVTLIISTACVVILGIFPSLIINLINNFF